MPRFGTVVVAGLVFAPFAMSCSEPAEPVGPPGMGGGAAVAGASAASGSGGTSGAGIGGSSPSTGGSVAAGSGGEVGPGGAGVGGTGGSGTAAAGTGAGGTGAGAGAGGTGGAGGGNAAGGGVGGSSGGTPSGGAAGVAGSAGGPATTCPSGAVFCDDFESYPEAAAPPLPKWKSWTVGAGTVLVDSVHGYGGGKAAHFHGRVSQAASTKEQAFMQAQGAAFPVTGTTLYVRFMMYATRFPFTGFSGANHVSLVWVGSANGLDNPDRGDPGKGYMLADYNGVAIEPMWDGYFRNTSTHFKDANLQNSWHCWEFEIDNAGGPPPGATGAALPHIWLDGTELRLTQAGGSTPYPAIPFERVMFALWSPQTDSSAGDFWIDEVAVSKSRINCPAAR